MNTKPGFVSYYIVNHFVGLLTRKEVYLKAGNTTFETQAIMPNCKVCKTEALTSERFSAHHSTSQKLITINLSYNVLFCFDFNQKCMQKPSAVKDILFTY